MKFEMDIEIGKNKRKAVDSKFDRLLYTIEVIYTFVTAMFAYSAYESHSYGLLACCFIFGIVGMNDMYEYITKGNRVRE